jgi:NAD(P)-dependent dehydrogenase (short-subunit alcohol dehydrogenase family)
MSVSAAWSRLASIVGARSHQFKQEALMTGRVAVITGANRGIGLETARQLLEHGYRVALTGRDIAGVERARRSLGSLAEFAIAEPLDVTDSASIAAAGRSIDARLGRVDILINNAAILVGDSAEVLSIPTRDYERTFETNVFGVIETCRVFVPGMAARRYGRVVNVSSRAGQLAGMSTYAPAYSMSKTALNALTRLLAASYKSSGVLVNAVDPGWVRTDMGGPSAPRSVEEGAETIVWLATLPDDGPTGGFFRDRRPVEW